MNHLLVLLAFLGGILAVPYHSHHQHNLKVINGQDAAPGQFPYMAALNTVDGDTWCGGVIIDTQWILTSADCVGVIFDDDYVMVGSIVNDHTAINFNITQIISHEEFDYFSLRNDIALIQIDGEFIYDDNIQAIEIGKGADNVSCTVTGWGMATDGTDPLILQYAEEITIGLETCKELAYDDSYYLGEDTVCGEGVNGANICWGDNGGPLVCDGVLAGIATYSLMDCGEYPDIFTRVDNYKDWIDSKIMGSKK